MVVGLWCTCGGFDFGCVFWVCVVLVCVVCLGLGGLCGFGLWVGWLFLGCECWFCGGLVGGFGFGEWVWVLGGWVVGLVVRCWLIVGLVCLIAVVFVVVGLGGCVGWFVLLIGFC